MRQGRKNPPTWSKTKPRITFYSDRKYLLETFPNINRSDNLGPSLDLTTRQEVRNFET